jgi:hypothetical protein
MKLAVQVVIASPVAVAARWASAFAAAITAVAAGLPFGSRLRS